MTSLVGSHAVVTGAASGIGRALAAELVRREATVTLIDIDAEGVQRAGQELGSRAIALDVRDEAALTAAAEDIGAVDLVFANAGVAAIGPFAEMPVTDMRWVIEVNVLGTMMLVRRFLPAMIACGRGRVVFTASIAGRLGAPGMSIYSASKFALVGLAESLRIELSGSGVGVTVVCPGYVRTGLHRATRYQNQGFRKFLEDAPAYFGLSAEQVARRTVDAALAGTPMLTLGLERGMVWLRDLSPDLYVALAGRLSRVLGLVGREA